MRRLLKRLLPPRRGGVAVAGVAVIALIAGMLVFGAHDAYPTTRVEQPSGLAWVSSDQIGSLTLLDGVAGQPVTNVPVTQADNDSLLAAQNGTTGFVLDQATGQLTRIDGSTYAPSPAPTPAAGTGIGADTELLLGTHTAYVVDGSGSTISTYDLATLRLLNGPTAFAGQSAHYSAIVDSADRLWVLNQDTGELDWFSATTAGRVSETFATGATLILTDGTPVVVDTESGRVSPVAPDGSVRTRLESGIIRESNSSAIRVTGAATQQALQVTDSARGIYESCDLVLGTCGAPQHAAFGGDALGPAVAADSRVFVPDYSTGTAWVLDPAGTAAPIHTGVLASAGTFDLFDRNGLVFYNDPRSARAGSIGADGTPRPITKYSTAAASGAPSTSASPTATAAIRTTGPTTSAPTTSAPPTHAAPTPTSVPPTGASPSVTTTTTPSPSPVPTGSGGNAPSCSSASSASASLPQSSAQGGTVLSNSDPSSPNPPSGRGRNLWNSTTQIAVAVIGALGAVIAAYILRPQTGNPAPANSGSTATVVAAKQSQSASAPAPLAPASGTIPPSPEANVQDPGGTGVYGVVFTGSGTFATGDQNGSAYLWRFGHDGSTNTLSDLSGQTIYGLAYSPHGNILAANTSDARHHYSTGSVVLWNATSGNYIKTLVVPDKASIGSPVAFSPDGSTVAVSGDKGTVFLYDTASYQVAAALTAPSVKPNFEIAYSPKTGYLAETNGNGTTYLWNTQTQSIVNRFRDPNSTGVHSLAFSPDGSLLATGDFNGNVYLWNVAGGTVTATLPGLAGGEVEDLAFSPRVGALAATLDDPHTKTYEFCIWNTAGKLLATRVNPGAIGDTKVAFSPDGSLLAVGDGNDSTYIWDVSGLT